MLERQNTEITEEAEANERRFKQLMKKRLSVISLMRSMVKKI